MGDTCTRCGMEAKYSIILSTYSSTASGQRQVRFCSACYAAHRAWLSVRVPSCDVGGGAEPTTFPQAMAEVKRLKKDQDLLRDVVRDRDAVVRERDEALADWRGVTEQWKHALGKLDEMTEEIATLRAALGTLPDAQVLSPLSVVECSCASEAEARAWPLTCPDCGCVWPLLTPGTETTVTCNCGKVLGCQSRRKP